MAELDLISDSVEKRREESIEFLQELIRTPSPSEHEADAAEIVADKTRSIGFDVVKTDQLFDVMASIRGIGKGRSLLLNGHLDHVPPGEMVDPYSGRIIDGSVFDALGKIVYGRGASDMKGAVAAMIMAGAVLKDLDFKLKGDFKIAAVAQEEVGGAGTMATIQEGHFLGDLVVVGEATNMDVSIGHRGGAGTSVIVKGKSCHASAPERGINALYKATDLIARIRSDLIPKLPDDPIFGKTTLVATKITVKPCTTNVVPEECEFYLDCRNTPNFTAEMLKRELESIISSMKNEDPQLDALVMPPNLIKGLKDFTGFYTDPEKYPIVNKVRDAISEVLGRQARLMVWRFATDGKFYSNLGIPVLGFGPCEERFTHTHEDHIMVEDYISAIKAYALLACRCCGAT